MTMWHFKLRGIYFIFTPESILRAFEETIKICCFGCSGYRFPLGSWGHCVELVQIIMRRVKFYGINVMLTLEAEITIFKKNQWKYGRSGSSRFWFRSGHFEEPLKNIMRHIKIRGIMMTWYLLRMPYRVTSVPDFPDTGSDEVIP